MRKIINNKVYDTDTARRIAGCEHGDGPRDFRYFHEALYCKRTGEYFLHGEGGPMTRYAEVTGLNSWRGGEKIIPISYGEAREWAEAEMDAEAYEAEFGPVVEEETVHLHISLPADIADRIRKAAQAEGTSVSECIGKRFQK